MRGSPRLALTAALDRMPVAVYPQVRSRTKDASAGQTRACAPCSGPLSCACRYRWEAFDNWTRDHVSQQTWNRPPPFRPGACEPETFGLAGCLRCACRRLAFAGSRLALGFAA